MVPQVYLLSGIRNDTLLEYDSLQSFTERATTTPTKVMQLPFYWQGTGHVVYNGFLYCHKADTPNQILKVCEKNLKPFCLHFISALSDHVWLHCMLEGWMKQRHTEWSHRSTTNHFKIADCNVSDFIFITVCFGLRTDSTSLQTNLVPEGSIWLYFLWYSASKVQWVPTACLS